MLHPIRQIDHFAKWSTVLTISRNGQFVDHFAKWSIILTISRNGKSIDHFAKWSKYVEF